MKNLTNTSVTFGNTECPRIYVACLAAYNSGHLYGAWIEAAQSQEEIQEKIKALLANSPILNAEEWAIHDYEGFDALTIHENESIAEVSEKALFIEKHGELGAELISYFNGDVEYAKEALEDNYQGEYEDELDYATYLFDECYLPNMPANARTYIDYEKFKQDIFTGDYFAIEVNGSSHIFANA